MRHKETLQLYHYWNEKRAGRPAPERSEIEPAGLGRLLPSVMLLERRGDDAIVFRLAGSRLCAFRCAELKGVSFTSLFPHGDRPGLTRILDSVDRNSALVVMDVAARRQGGSDVRLEMALFPLVDESARILGIVSTKSSPEWLGVVPAQLELRGVRYMDPDAELAFLQSRPSIPVHRRVGSAPDTAQMGLHVIPGTGQNGPKRALHAFRVVDGGKK